MKISIDILKELKARSLTLKDQSLTNAQLDWNTPQELTCSKGHHFISPMKNVIRPGRAVKENAGCSECHSIELKNVSTTAARNNILAGHQLLSSELRDTERKDGGKSRYYQARCPDGHTYWKLTAELSRGCPTCNEKIFVGQEKVRAILEAHFNAEFPSVRPDWLTNEKTGKALEIDGYNEKLKIGFEFQGRQHVSRDTQFNSDFEAQTERDKIKEEMCSARGIKLLVVHQPTTYAPKQFFQSIKSQVAEYGIVLNDQLVDKMQVVSAVAPQKFFASKLLEFKEYVEERGYTLNSCTLESLNGDNLSFTCPKDHTFEMTGERFKQHYGRAYKSDTVAERCPCGVCKMELENTRRQIDIGYCKELADKVGWKVVSPEYQKKNAPMKFMCPNGHEAETTFRLFERAVESNGGMKCKICGPSKKQEQTHSTKDVDAVEKSESKEVKTKSLGLEEQIEAGLSNPMEAIRLVFATQPTFHFTKEQVERGLRDPSEQVQLAFIQRDDFIPTKEQIEWGAAHKNEKINDLFSAYTSVRAWEVYQEMRRLKAKLAESEKEMAAMRLKS